MSHNEGQDHGDDVPAAEPVRCGNPDCPVTVPPPTNAAHGWYCGRDCRPSVRSGPVPSTWGLKVLAIIRADLVAMFPVRLSPNREVATDAQRRINTLTALADDLERGKPLPDGWVPVWRPEWLDRVPRGRPRIVPAVREPMPAWAEEAVARNTRLRVQG